MGQTGNFPSNKVIRIGSPTTPHENIRQTSSPANKSRRFSKLLLLNSCVDMGIFWWVLKASPLKYVEINAQYNDGSFDNSPFWWGMCTWVGGTQKLCAWRKTVNQFAVKTVDFYSQLNVLICCFTFSRSKFGRSSFGLNLFFSLFLRFSNFWRAKFTTYQWWKTVYTTKIPTCFDTIIEVNSIQKYYLNPKISKNRDI